MPNVPPGGLDLISRFQMSRSWGFPASAATSATIASWVFAAASKLVLPIVAVAFLTIRSVRADDLDLREAQHAQHPSAAWAFSAAWTRAGVNGRRVSQMPQAS